MKFYLFALFAGLIISSCCNSTCRKDTGQEYEEYVYGVRLVEDSAMVTRYLEYHENVWPEVEAGFKKAGYSQIRLYRFGNYLTMIIQVPKGSNLDEMGKISNDSSPRAAEWNRLMGTFQRGLPGTVEGETWVQMERIYAYGE